MGFREKDISVYIYREKYWIMNQYGKGEEFLRPVVVVKKFGKDSFL